MRLVAGVLLLAGVQGPAERSLSTATVERKNGFTEITAIRELGDGRVLLIDWGEKAVKLVDLAHGSATQVGRQGGGPGEYARPTLLLALPGDSTLLVDRGQLRAIIIGPDGKAGDVYLTAAELTAAPPGARTPSALDARGRLYFQNGGMDMSGGLPKALDSLSLMLWDRRTGKTDTLVRIRQVKADIRITREGKAIKSINILKWPFLPHDDWDLAPDGTLLVVRTEPYRLDRRDPAGALHQGPRLAYTPIAVSDSERKGSPDIPRFKPPFDGPSTFRAPDGRVWVHRTTPAADSTARYDVLDSGGRLLARVAFPARTRLAGFGKGVLYMVRRDEDDLEYLGWLALPVL